MHPKNHIYLLFFIAGCSSNQITPVTWEYSNTHDPALMDSSSEHSDYAKIRFKRAERLSNDLMFLLQLHKSEICKELGKFDCINEVHKITLGGVEPYVSGVAEPSKTTLATTPIVIERILLSACKTRVDKDLKTPDKAIWLTNSRISKPQDTSELVNVFYQQALFRTPSTEEQEAFSELYRSYTEDEKPQPLRDWAIGTCFAILSSIEYLFY